MTHWDNQAKQWASLGPPLKPSSIDIQNHILWLNRHTQFDKPLKIIVLGVTPELVNISWPSQSSLFAIDYNSEMLKSILPAQTPFIEPIGVLGNWLQLPISSSSIDLVLGDGCYSLLASKDYQFMTKEIKRVLKPSGLCVMRFFSKPEKSESIESIHKDLLLGKNQNFHAFKLRLAMALHHDLNKGICLQHVWDVWNTHFKQDVIKNKSKLKWDDKVINSINSYQNSQDIYTFPTLSEIKSTLTQEFIENELYIPTYPFGARCPTFKLTSVGLIDEANSI